MCLLFVADSALAAVRGPATSTNGSFTISWDPVVGASSYQIIDHSAGQSFTLSGTSKSFTKTANGNYKYTVFASVPSGSGGFSFGYSNVGIGEATVAVKFPPTVSASFNTSSINEGGSATFSWSSTRATSCSATGIAGVSATSGSKTYTALSVMSSDLTAGVKVTCTGTGGSKSATAFLLIKYINDTPTISQTANTTINEDGNTGYLGLTVADEETSAGSLTVTASSNNTSLIPNNRISLAGTGANRLIKATPATNQYGSATITYTVTDAGNKSASRSFKVTVRPVNDAPIINQGTNTPLSTKEDTAKSITLTATDVDNTASQLTWSLDSAPSHGTAPVSGSGYSKSITYTPAKDYFGSDSFRVKVKDTGNLSDFITVNVTVTSVNDAPVITQGTSYSFSTKEDTAKSITLNASDVDHSASQLTWSLYSGPSHGSVPVSGTGYSKSMTYKPAKDYFGSDSFKVKVNDGGNLFDIITVSVTVTPVNDAPVIDQGSSDTLITSEDFAKSITLSAKDVDNTGSQLRWYLDSAPSHGSVPVSGTGYSKPMTYTPDLDYSGSDSFKVRVKDSGGLFDVITVYVTVRSVYDAPVISQGSSYSFTTAEDTAKSFTLKAGDVDNAGSELTWNLAASPNNGSAPVSGSGYNKTITYTPNDNYSGSDSFEVIVTDLSGLSDTITINFTVTPENDLPTGTVTIIGLPNVGVTLTTENDLSDADGMGPFIYSWKRDGATIPNASSQPYTLVDADIGANITATISYTDGGGTLESVTSLPVGPVESSTVPPEAIGGEDQTVARNTVVTLLGSCTDVDGTIESCLWTQIPADEFGLQNKEPGKASFTAPHVEVETNLTFRLTAIDNDGLSDFGDVTITVLPKDAPVADAGPDQTVIKTSEVTLPGSGTDADGMIVGYLWEQVLPEETPAENETPPENETITLTNETTDVANFTAPDVTELKILTFKLTVTDDDGLTGSDEVAITVEANTASRKVIFIHTDLLGSPAVETNEEGEVIGND